MSENYTVVAFLQSKPDKAEDLREELLHVANESRKESGNVSYRVVQDVAEPSKFSLFEEWASKEVHDAQYQKPYITTLVARLELLLGEPFKIVCGDVISR